MRAVTALTLLQGYLAHAIALPPPTGKYNIGMIKHDIPHYNANDPLAPNNISTAFLATIYYPTLQTPRGPPQAYLEPALAAPMEAQFNYTPGFLTTFTSHVQPHAPFLAHPKKTGQTLMPTLLFGPGGGGPPVSGNTILISELVSHGYTVVGLDHPYEQPFLRYANGTGVSGVDINYDDLALIERIYDTRLIDNSAFLAQFPSLVEKLNAPFNKTHMGVFGYSLGGAAAVGQIYNDSRLVSALNLDGSQFGAPTAEDPAVADAKKPVFLVGSEGHTADDPTWGKFIDKQTGYLRMINVEGSKHLDMFDNTFWKTKMEGVEYNHGAGTVDGMRMYEILNVYVRAFFDFTLLGKKERVLDGPEARWPEVVFGARKG
ncbi:hypothetical protein F4808DRAFT_271523 [Astrocystis sublimbata]|nr:hypothetical protein F4808DRAFT_271523 [Astrocystis sublimbata]